MHRSRCRTPNKCQSRSSQMGMGSILCAGSLSPPSTVILTRAPSSSTYSQKLLRRQLLQQRQRQLHRLQVELHCGCSTWGEQHAPGHRRAARINGHVTYAHTASIMTTAWRRSLTERRNIHARTPLFLVPISMLLCQCADLRRHYACFCTWHLAGADQAAIASRWVHYSRIAPDRSTRPPDRGGPDCVDGRDALKHRWHSSKTPSRA